MLRAAAARLCALTFACEALPAFRLWHSADTDRQHLVYCRGIFLAVQ